MIFSHPYDLFFYVFIKGYFREDAMKSQPCDEIHLLFLATKAQRHKETPKVFILRKKILPLYPLVSLCLGGKEKVRN
jgi:hypothetical protein